MGEAARSFEDLWIWQRARELVPLVYGDFGEKSVAARDFGFRSQIQRAAISIMNNISEGFERTSDRDFSHFLTIARASCGEVRSMYYAAEDLNYVEAAVAEERRIRTRQLASGISKLQSHLTKQ